MHYEAQYIPCLIEYLLQYEQAVVHVFLARIYRCKSLLKNPSGAVRFGPLSTEVYIMQNTMVVVGGWPLGERKKRENCIKIVKRPLKCIFLGYNIWKFSPPPPPAAIFLIFEKKFISLPLHGSTNEKIFQHSEAQHIPCFHNLYTTQGWRTVIFCTTLCTNLYDNNVRWSGNYPPPNEFLH